MTQKLIGVRRMKDKFKFKLCLNLTNNNIDLIHNMFISIYMNNILQNNMG